jgi:AraC-like DNA-binding protein
MLGPGWMIMRAAENIEQALLDFVRLYGLYTDAASLRAERVRGALRLHSSFLPVGRFGTRQAVNLTLGAMCNFVRENLPRDWFPQRVDLRLTPDHPGRFVAFFGSGVRFGQEHDALYVDRPTLGRPLGEGTERRAVHEALLRRNTGPGSAVAAQVRSLLSGFVRQDPCNIDLVAAALAVSPRTVQRRLAAAGTSYRELVDEVRADLAWRQVRHSELSVARVAELLGYRSAAAFSRAFRRWHGQSPRAARGPREPAT